MGGGPRSPVVALALSQCPKLISYLGTDLLTPASTASTDSHVIVECRRLGFKAHCTAWTPFWLLTRLSSLSPFLPFFFFFIRKIHPSSPSCPRSFRRATLRRTTRGMTCILLSMGMCMISPSSRMTIPVCFPPPNFSRRCYQSPLSFPLLFFSVPADLHILHRRQEDSPASRWQGRLQNLLEIPQRGHPEKVQGQAAGRLARQQAQA